MTGDRNQIPSNAAGPEPEGGQRPARESGGDVRTTLAGHRTTFAMFRTSLALDRTTLAWIRTGLTFASFGFGMIAFFRTAALATHNQQAVRLHHGAIRLGLALVVLGMLAILLTGITHWMALRRLRRGEQVSITQWPLSITVAVLIVILCLYALWSVFAA